MKREDMVCENCIKFDSNGPSSELLGSLAVGPECRLNPQPYLFKDSPYDPKSHWCAQGEWTLWNDRFECSMAYLWGEWTDQKPEEKDDAS